jgi:hypothetical protein
MTAKKRCKANRISAMASFGYSVMELARVREKAHIQNHLG